MTVLHIIYLVAKYRSLKQWGRGSNMVGDQCYLYNLARDSNGTKLVSMVEQKRRGSENEVGRRTKGDETQTAVSTKITS